jgi:long-subunit fatty acid transport protein
MRKTIVVLLSVFFSSGIYAGGGSSYSSSTFGLVEYRPNARSVAMGGINLAVPSASSVNLYNPATLIGITTTRFDGGIFIEADQARNGVAQANSSTANINQACLAIPFGNRFAAAFSLSRLTRVDYDYHTVSHNLNDQGYTSVLEGTGGTQQLAFTFAGKINSHWTAGASANYVFGTVNRDWHLTWISPDNQATLDSRAEHIHGLRWTVGALYDQGNFRLGGFMTLSNRFKKDITVTGASGDTSYNSYQTTSFPIQIGLGGMYAISKDYSAGMDVIYTGWHRITSFDATQRNRNTARIGLGVEKAPRSSLSAGFFGKASYRAGFYFQNLYATNASGNFASEYFATFGMGIPFNKGKSMFDIGVEMGVRGSVAENRVQDRILRFTLSVSGGERWFQNRRKR